MYICTYCDIVHSERNCPLCRASERIDELEDQNKELQNEVQELKEENKDLLNSQN